jgi:hypothetical protein
MANTLKDYLENQKEERSSRKRILYSYSFLLFQLPVEATYTLVKGTKTKKI